MAAPLRKSDLFAPSAAESLSQIVLRLADPTVHAEIASPVQALQSGIEGRWSRDNTNWKARMAPAAVLVIASGFWLTVAMNLVRAIAPH